MTKKCEQRNRQMNKLVDRQSYEFMELGDRC